MSQYLIHTLSSARKVGVGLALFLSVGIAQAHVVVTPTQSKISKKEIYTLAVPTEGKSATIAVELDTPQV